MKIVIIVGSSRAQSQSRKVSEFLQARLQGKDVEADIMDLHELDLPPYDPDNEYKELDVLKDRLQNAEGYVLISPEWDGMVNHRIISLYHYIGQTMADKPVLAVGVSSTFHGGHYPVEQMRMMGPKNKHFVVIPEHLVVMNVKNVMNSHDLEGDESDVFIKKRADYALATLVEYAKALKQVRSSGVIDYDTYPNGM